MCHFLLYSNIILIKREYETWLVGNSFYLHSLGLNMTIISHITDKVIATLTFLIHIEHTTYN